MFLKWQMPSRRIWTMSLNTSPKRTPTGTQSQPHTSSYQLQSPRNRSWSHVSRLRFRGHGRSGAKELQSGCYVKSVSRDVQQRSKQVVALINVAQTSNLLSQKEELIIKREQQRGNGRSNASKATKAGSLFVFGLGYVARGLATQLQAQGW